MKHLKHVAPGILLILGAVISALLFLIGTLYPDLSATTTSAIQWITYGAAAMMLAYTVLT